MSQISNSPSSILQAIKSGARNLVERWRYQRAHPAIKISPASPQLTNAVQELRKYGYYVVPNYYSPERCETLRAEIDRIAKEQPDAIQGDSLHADQRLFGAERASADIAAYNGDTFPLSVGEAYHGRPLKAFSTLAGRIEAKPGNIGSGQGWHRDAFHFQYKSLIYLTDVDEDHGPFQLLEGSHRALHVFTDTVVGRLPPAPYSRLSCEQVGSLITKAPNRLKTLVAKAGSLVLFDSSAIHRGAPINTGVRYALTNYYYEPEQITPAIVKAFEPYARPA